MMIDVVEAPVRSAPDELIFLFWNGTTRYIVVNSPC